MNTTACGICEYATEHGSWPPKHRGTHCRDCHRSWTSLKEAHCTVCHEHFSTDNHAQTHRRSSGPCTYPGDVLNTDGEARMRLVDRGTGPVWVSAREMDPARFAVDV